MCGLSHVSDSNNINSNGRQAHDPCLSKRDRSYKNSHRKDNVQQSTANQLDQSGSFAAPSSLMRCNVCKSASNWRGDSCDVVKLINLSSHVLIAKFVSWLAWRLFLTVHHFWVIYSLNRHTNHRLLFPCCCPLVNSIPGTAVPKQHHTQGRAVVPIISGTLGPLPCTHNRPAMKYDSNSSCVILL